MRGSFIVVSCVLVFGAVAQAGDPDPGKPLQTQNTKQDDAWLLQGWTANILGVSGAGKTLLVVEGDEGYQVTAQIDPANPAGQTLASPATFALADQDYRIPVKVTEPRGATWTETVDVPKGMKITVQVKARYEHRGYEGTIKNDTAGCKKKQDRKWYRIQITQGGEAVGNPIELDPGRTAPEVRLKIGSYDVKILERNGNVVRTDKLEVKEQQWRFDVKCPE